MQINKLHLGNCLHLMKNLPSQSINMILCDLPYGTTKCKWDTPIDLSDLWFNYKRIIKPNGAILLFAQTPFDKVLGCSNLAWLRYEWIWEKTQATGYLNAKKMPMKAHENILVFYKKPPTFNPIKTIGHTLKVSSAFHKRKTIHTDIYGKHDSYRDYKSTERYPRSIQKFSSDKQKSSLHSTQKPIELCKYFVKTYTNEGDLVLDNCAGSGTTAISCIDTNRNFIAIEKDKDIFKIAEERIKNYRINELF